MKPTVVVNTFDRPHSLDRLLRSLEGCAAPTGTDVVISIDGGGSDPDATMAVARSLRWDSGDIRIIEQEDLGLVRHFRRCGDLVDDYGSIVLLEDDLIVGPNALLFAGAALAATEGDHRIDGVSLSTPWFDGFRQLPFEPLIDGSDGLFAKLPWFHGMAWTAPQWQRSRVGASADPGTPLPAAFDALVEEEWFPAAVRSLVETDHWYLLARQAQAINFGEPGVHFDASTAFFQQPLVQGRFHPPRFPSLDDREVLPYDEYLEPDPRWFCRRVPVLDAMSVTMDLRGLRPIEQITTEWVVTTRRTRKQAHRWGAVMRPIEQNILSDVPGNAIGLALTSDIVDDKRSTDRAEVINVNHSFRDRPPGIRGALRRKVQRRTSGTGKMR